jgi:hypothetical protein
MRTGFRHPDLIGWTIEHRMELIRAILILFRAWHAAGQPSAKDVPPLGTFSQWARTVGSILAYVGITGFLGNLTQSYDEADEISAQWEMFLQTWHEIFGCNWIKIADIVHFMMQPPNNESLLQDQPTVDLVEALPERLQVVLKEKPHSFKTRFGQELRKRVGECFGDSNLHLEQGTKDRKGAILWRVNSGTAEVVSANSHAKHPHYPHESAGNAEVAEVVSVSSHGKNEIPFQNGVSKDIYRDEGKSSQRSPQGQKTEMPQTSLGSSLMPIANGANSAIESPALPATADSVTADKVTLDAITDDGIMANGVTMDAIPKGHTVNRVPTHSGDKSPQILSPLPALSDLSDTITTDAPANNDLTPNNSKNKQIAPYCPIIPIDDEWEEVEI